MEELKSVQLISGETYIIHRIAPVYYQNRGLRVFMGTYISTDTGSCYFTNITELGGTHKSTILLTSTKKIKLNQLYFGSWKYYKLTIISDIDTEFKQRREVNEYINEVDNVGSTLHRLLGCPYLKYEVTKFLAPKRIVMNKYRESQKKCKKLKT